MVFETWSALSDNRRFVIGKCNCGGRYGLMVSQRKQEQIPFFHLEVVLMIAILHVAEKYLQFL